MASSLTCLWPTLGDASHWTEITDICQAHRDDVSNMHLLQHMLSILLSPWAASYSFRLSTLHFVSILTRQSHETLNDKVSTLHTYCRSWNFDAKCFHTGANILMNSARESWDFCSWLAGFKHVFHVKYFVAARLLQNFCASRPWTQLVKQAKGTWFPHRECLVIHASKACWGPLCSYVLFIKNVLYKNAKFSALLVCELSRQRRCTG